MSGAAAERKPWQFGAPGVDPVELGRRGGTAPRRPPTIAAAKRQILQSRNGQAAYQLLAMELKALEQREQALLAKDRELGELDLALYDTREALDQARDELRAVDERVAESQARLEAARDGHDALVDVLRTAGEERVEVALSQLGWLADAEAAP
jgi:hypothetical protein